MFQGPLQVQPNMADKIVLAACCLHNFLTQDTQETQETLMDENEVSDGNGLIDIEPLNRNPSQEAIQVREAYKTYFVSPQGQVPWQMQAITQGRTQFN